MKIALFSGGLGNQVFQYIFARYVELETGEPCFLDNSSLCQTKVAHNGYEMNVVFPNSHPRLLSEHFTEDVWQYMVGRREQGIGICQQLYSDGGVNLTMVAETDNYQFDGTVVPVPTNEFMPRICHAKGDIYYHGYWINRDWLKGPHHREIVRELEFRPIEDEKNLRLLEKIQSTNSVSLHVRRGDFLDCHWDAPVKEYCLAVESLKKHVADPHFFVFSDDIPWCKKNEEELGLQDTQVTYVEGNTGRNAYIDMILMSYCKNMALVTSSSFSYLAALLNHNPEIGLYNRTMRRV